jgi:hypothetical protein
MRSSSRFGHAVPVLKTAFAGFLIVRRAFPKQAMEMTEYGKHGKPRNRLSTLPTLFGNPCGITTFPQPRLLANFKMQDQERPNPRPLDHKGVVMEVPGPKCNGCSGTLTPLSVFCCCCCFCFSTHQGRRCGQERGRYETQFRRCQEGANAAPDALRISDCAFRGPLDQVR